MTDLDRYSQDLGFRLDRWQILARTAAKLIHEPAMLENESAENWRVELLRLWTLYDRAD